MNYYIADTHLGHENIIRLSSRPFDSVEEMDRNIVDNWNKKVKENDHVYILGDFSYKSKEPSCYLRQLNGIKHLIVGNHDINLLKSHACRKHFVEIVDMKTVIDNGTRIVCCHYPLVEWDGYYRGTLHFYGHVHNTYDNDTTRYAAGMKNAYNVGVDVIGFEPKTLSEILGKG